MNFEEFYGQSIINEFDKKIKAVSFYIAAPLQTYWLIGDIFIVGRETYVILLRFLIVVISLLAPFVIIKLKTIGQKSVLTIFYGLIHMGFTYFFLYVNKRPELYYAGLNLVGLSSLAFLPWRPKEAIINAILLYTPFVFFILFTKSFIYDLPILHSVTFSTISLMFISMSIWYFNSILRKRELRARFDLAKISAQVAHDINSPLAALDTGISYFDSASNEHVKIIKNAVRRIKDISNGLRIKQDYELREAQESKAKDITAVYVKGVLETIVSEKRLQFNKLSNVEIDYTIPGDGHTLFAKANVYELQRVLSNLLNNAVEAFKGQGKGQGKGQVSVELTSKDDLIQIKIIDNGSGIPSEILDKVKRRGFSYGKKHGSGLGLAHAFEVVEEIWGGQLNISSQENIGTTIEILLLKQDLPAWCIGNLQLKKKVVIVDDERSVIQSWNYRLKNEFKTDIEVLTYNNINEFETWIDKNIHVKDKYSYLIDYEFLGESNNGVKIIEKLDIAKNSILVTSHYEDQTILAKASKLDLKILQKDRISTVKIVLDIRLEDNAGTKVQDLQDKRDKQQVFDAVLIDDDDLIHLIWKTRAEDVNKKIKMFKSVAEFWQSEHLISYETPIYIDSNLEDGVKGEIEARIIFEKGFKTIYLATGCEADEFEEYGYLLGVRSKEPPW